jgi:hypothetical protein
MLGLDASGVHSTDQEKRSAIWSVCAGLLSYKQAELRYGLKKRTLSRYVAVFKRDILQKSDIKQVSLRGQLS